MLICFCQTFLQELRVVYVCCALLVCVCFVRVGAAFCIVSCIFYFVLFHFKNGGELAPSLVGWSPARLGREWSLVRVDSPRNGRGIPREACISLQLNVILTDCIFSSKFLIQ